MPTPGVVYDFCLGRGAQYPVEFLGRREKVGRAAGAARCVRDEYRAYDSVVDATTYPDASAAGCLAHARRKFDELIKHDGTSAVAPEALRRIARIYRVERELAGMSERGAAGAAQAARQAAVGGAA